MPQGRHPVFEGDKRADLIEQKVGGEDVGGIAEMAIPIAMGFSQRQCNERFARIGAMCLHQRPDGALEQGFNALPVLIITRLCHQQDTKPKARCLQRRQILVGKGVFQGRIVAPHGLDDFALLLKPARVGQKLDRVENFSLRDRDLTGNRVLDNRLFDKTLSDAV